MATFVRGSNPIWYMVDLDGLQLNSEYFAIFLSNVFPYIPQAPTHDFEGQIPWAGGKVQFNANGTLPADIYFDPDLVYRIEIRHGSTQADPLVYEINNYEVNSGSVNNNNDLLGGNNMITNPQFSDISFVSPYTFTKSLSDTYIIDFANGWELVLIGQGTTVLTQLVQPGTDDIVGNPPYAIRINNNGWDEAYLRQRFSKNGAIFAGGAIAMSATVRASVTLQSMTLVYSPSSPGTPIEIVTENIPVGDYQIIQGATDLPLSTNTNTGEDAYVDMQIVLEATGIMDITNVQVIGQNVPLPTDFDATTDIPSFIQETIERIEDNTFHIYRPELIYKPIPSWLVGWDFPLNPAQTGDTIAARAIGANKSKFIWDMTILFQSANTGVGVLRGTDGELLLTAAADTQMAVIQYIDQAQAREILNSPISVNFSGRATTNTTCTISLWYTTDVSLPSISSSNSSIVGTLDANGKPATFNGNWTEVPIITGVTPQFICGTSANTNFNDTMLTGWDMEGISAVSTATYMAIVVGFAQITTGNSIGINSVSLNSGRLATRPAPQTPDQVLRECRASYEQSYNKGVAPGTVTDAGIYFSPNALVANGGNYSVRRWPIFIQYEATKRIAPTVKFYSPSAGTADRVDVLVKDGSTINSTTLVDISTYSSITLTKDRLLYTANTNTELATGAYAPVHYMLTQFHYILDSRMGA